MDQDETETEPTQQQQSDIQTQLENPLSLYTASSDPDVLYLHKALWAADQNEFLKTIDIEILGHEQGQHWAVLYCTSVPKGTKALNAVWALHRNDELIHN